MDNRDVVCASGALIAGWNAFKKAPGVAVGGFLLFYLIMVLGLGIPFLGPVLLGFPVIGGLTVLCLNIVRGKDHHISDLFAGFKCYGMWLVVGLLYMLMIAVVTLLIMTLLWMVVLLSHASSIINYATGSAQALPALRYGQAIPLGGSFISILLLWILTLRWLFVCHLVSDGVEPLEAFRRSSELTKGRRFKLFYISLVLVLFSITGLLFIGLGMLITVAVSYLALTSIYVDLASS